MRMRRAPLTVLMASAVPRFSLDISDVLESEPDIRTLVCNGEPGALTRLARDSAPEVALLDFCLPRERLYALNAHLRRFSIPSLVVGRAMSSDALEWLHLGVSGLAEWPADRSDMSRIVRVVAAGGLCIGSGLHRQLPEFISRDRSPWEPRAPGPSYRPLRDACGPVFGLTPREIQVLEAVIDGSINREVADTLGITTRTVKNHLSHIFRKTGARNRTELVGLASRTTAPETLRPSWTRIRRLETGTTVRSGNFSPQHAAASAAAGVAIADK